MTDPAVLSAVLAAALLGLSLTAGAALKAWRGWLELKRAEIEANPSSDFIPSTSARRVELADLRERVRKLEAIASGIDF